jgi:hypothetical protein
MSRSKKKNSIVKDSKGTDNWFNKIFRRVNKQKIKSGEDPIEMNELVNKYNVRDYKFFTFCNKDLRK